MSSCSHQVGRGVPDAFHNRGVRLDPPPPPRAPLRLDSALGRPPPTVPRLVGNPDSKVALEAMLAERRANGEGPPAPVVQEIVVAVQPEPRGTAHALLCARAALEAFDGGFEGTLLVLCGDTPCVSPRSLAS